MSTPDPSAADVHTVMSVMAEFSGSIDFPYLGNIEFAPQKDIEAVIPQKLLVGEFKGDPVYCYIVLGSQGRGGFVRQMVQMYRNRRAPTALQSALDVPPPRSIAYREPFLTLLDRKTHITDGSFIQQLYAFVKACFIMKGLTKSAPMDPGSEFPRLFKTALFAIEGRTLRGRKRKSTMNMASDLAKHGQGKRQNQHTDDEQDELPAPMPRMDLSTPAHVHHTNVREMLISRYLRAESTQRQQQQKLDEEERELKAITEETKALAEQMKNIEKRLEDASADGNNRKLKICAINDEIKEMHETKKQIKAQMSGEEGFALAMRLMNGPLGGKEEEGHNENGKNHNGGDETANEWEEKLELGVVLGTEETEDT